MFNPKILNISFVFFPSQLDFFDMCAERTDLAVLYHPLDCAGFAFKKSLDFATRQILDEPPYCEAVCSCFGSMPEADSLDKPPDKHPDADILPKFCHNRDFVDLFLYILTNFMPQNNIEVEIRSFISPRQYEELIEFFKNAASFVNEDYQVTYYFSGEQDLRIQKNNFFNPFYVSDKRYRFFSRLRKISG